MDDVDDDFGSKFELFSIKHFVNRGSSALV